MLLWSSACLAQPFEFGGMAGYGVYRNATVDAPAGTASAGIRNRFVAGAVWGEDLYEHLSGELRYLYQDGDPFVSAGTSQGNVQGQSHALHYDLLFELAPREARLRPYFAVGGGGKYYRVTGPPPVTQPLPQIVTLTTRSQFSALFTGGVGVRYEIVNRVFLRADFLDYITPFPTKLFRPAPFGTDRGLFHQFTPTIGISFRP